MTENIKLPPEIENRLFRIREQLKPLELPESKNYTYLTKLDQKSLLAISVIVLAAVAMSVVWWSGAQWTNSAPNVPQQNTENFFAEQPKQVPNLESIIYVHVFGEVNNPGVYELASGSRVFEAIAAAGGQSNQRLITINLAETLNDGDQIFLGPDSQLTPSKVGIQNKKNKDKKDCIDINTADLAALDTLPGIGPVMAQKIIDWRADNGGFKSISQLNEVKGIGIAKYADIEKKVCI